MTTFAQFSDRCKMRHDFDDQIQVRYWHDDDAYYDTWVSGDEALQRLETLEAEEQIRSLGGLTVDDLQVVTESLPEAVREAVRRSLRDELADHFESAVGGNLIGDALSNAVRGRSPSSRSTMSDKDRWLALLHYEPFRQKVLELAWIQLEGSIPENDTRTEPDDWL